MAHSKVRGHTTIIQYCYLMGQRGQGIRYREEIGRGLMIEPERLCELMRASGLVPRFLARGFKRERGLLIGVKPCAAAPS